MIVETQSFVFCGHFQPLYRLSNLTLAPNKGLGKANKEGTLGKIITKLPKMVKLWKNRKNSEHSWGSRMVSRVRYMWENQPVQPSLAQPFSSQAAQSQSRAKSAISANQQISQAGARFHVLLQPSLVCMNCTCVVWTVHTLNFYQVKIEENWRFSGKSAKCVKMCYQFCLFHGLQFRTIVC